MAWTCLCKLPYVAAGAILILSIVLGTTMEPEVEEKVLQLTTDMKKMYDEDPNLVNIFQDTISSLQVQLGVTSTTGKATSSSECIEAFFENAEVSVYNRCEETRKVTVKCQGRKAECVIAPRDSSLRCGKCGAPTIIKDDFDDGGEG
eukprot:GFYU01003945.1.p1 GENE.GFYU01003945.1~~GFYU01003945.1.p1  ORF type:complete len:147 (-),score=34.60 GFYU01003945.1:282-722(-)